MEGYKPPKFYSAEQSLVIDRESGYFNAIKYATDPIKYLAGYRQALISSGFPYEEICQQTIAEVAELEDIIRNDKLEIADSRVKEILDAEYATEAWAMNIFTLLKEAGFTEEEALSYVIMDDEEFTREELMKERFVRFFIKQVYGSE